MQEQKRRVAKSGAFSESHDGTVAFLRRSSLVRSSLAAFCRVTGMVAKIFRSTVSLQESNFGKTDNEFCRALSALSHGCSGCRAAQSDLFRTVECKLRAKRTCCPAGMLFMAAPIVARGGQIASIVGGKVRVNPVNRAGFERIAA